ncbi:EAL domain-containing protein [Pleurocapsales cyanobacterium LEGE 06147]|nr:EAL domain-containing protein [Pleurocapsales cyanobacterium LEGE 06147]
MNKLLRVLIVEDSEDDAELLAIELERGGYQPIYQRVDTRVDMQTALRDKKPWDVVLADYSMPQFSAIAALNLLKEQDLDLPFIIVSGKIGEDTAVAAMKAGAHDYIVKGKLARLVPAVERELREAVIRQEHRQAQERLKYLAYYDELTNLPNRSLFLEHLHQQIKPVSGKKNQKEGLFAVLFLCIDRFPMIKYSLGHFLSDRMLVAAARRIQKCVSSRDIVARIGANEFAILLTKLEREETAQQIAEQIYHQLSIPFELRERLIFSPISIGIALSTLGYNQPEKWLQAADTAMYHAKLDSTKGLMLFNEGMYQSAMERLRLESDLRQAINDGQLHLNYQPIVSLTTGKIEGLETLVRWQHSSLGLIPPEKFVLLSEETGLIVPLGQWILSEACKQLVVWQQQFPQLLTLSISVNLSGIQLSSPNLISQIDELLNCLELKGENLKLEITESTLMKNSSAVTNVLEQLKARNIKLCIDDFGIGYSSLSYLRYLPIDTVKIDRSFICQENCQKNFDIVKAIVNLAHNLGLDVIAEGIETETQLEILRRLGCEYGQGYLFSQPLDHEAIIALLRQEFASKNYI